MKFQTLAYQAVIMAPSHAGDPHELDHPQAETLYSSNEEAETALLYMVEDLERELSSGLYYKADGGVFCPNTYTTFSSKEEYFNSIFTDGTYDFFIRVVFR